MNNEKVKLLIEESRKVSKNELLYPSYETLVKSEQFKLSDFKVKISEKTRITSEVLIDETCNEVETKEFRKTYKKIMISSIDDEQTKNITLRLKDLKLLNKVKFIRDDMSIINSRVTVYHGYLEMTFDSQIDDVDFIPQVQKIVREECKNRM